MSNHAKGMTYQPQKGHGWAYVTHFCIWNRGLRKIVPQHTIKWGQLNTAIDDGPVFLTSMTADTNDAVH